MYSGLIFSYGMVSSLLPLQVTVTADIFEDANHALSISEFFLYGKLPILETFDAHMFSKSMWGFLYTFLNQDLSGGIFCTYEVYINVVLIIILWILLQNMFHQDFAFLATVFFPISLLSYSIMIPILSVLFMINALHKRSFRSFLLFWFSLALTCLFSLDAGFSACLTSILLVVLTYLQKRKEFKKRNIILPFVFVVSFFIIIFIVLSLFRNVNLIDVTREFLSVSLSNENWGIGLGDAERPIFSFVYVIVPFSLVISFAYILYYRYKNNIHPLSTSFLLVSSFAIMYFINLSRILVRHTASENGLINLFYTSLFFFLFLAVILRPKRKELFFSVGVVLFVLLLAFARNAPFRDTYEGVFEKSINNTAFEQILADYPKVKVERVNLSNDTLLETRNVLNMINAVIDERDTYIDFTNHSLIYYLSGHEKPVYINQSPGLLSGESAQLSFLKQAKAKQPKFVLMPVRDNYLSAFLDGINNSARYYLVSEYIYKNYVPLCKTDSYALWIQKENHSEYVAAIRNMDSYQDSFSTVDIQAFSSNLSFEDAYSVVDNKIIINCEGQRPIVRNLESIFDYAGLVASASNLTIQVECSSDIDGSVQFIQEGADERRMKAFSLFGNENKCLTFNVSVDKETQIYLMPPVDSHFIIHSISILNNDCPFILVSYETAADKDVHSFDLGMIPYLWGNVDSGSAWANPVISRAIINKGDYFSIDPSQTSEPKYILLTVDSLDRGSASLQFGLWKDGVFTPLNDFSFEILPGEGNKYILRPSMDFFWYSGKINAAVISSENDMTAVDIQLLEDDSI